MFLLRDGAKASVSKPLRYEESHCLLSINVCNSIVSKPLRYEESGTLIVNLLMM